MHLIIWDIGIDASRRGPCETAIKVNLSVSRRVQGGAVCFSHCGAIRSRSLQLTWQVLQSRGCL